MTPTSTAPVGWMLYDAGCGICARWVPFRAPALARLRIEIAPLGAPWVAARIALPPSALRRDIRLLLQGGRQLAGADVYRYVLRRLCAYPLYLIAAAPGLRRLFDRAYRLFADRRLRISDACGLPSPGPGTGGGVPDPPAAAPPRRAFLTAQWRYLVMLKRRKLISPRRRNAGPCPE